MATVPLEAGESDCRRTAILPPAVLSRQPIIHASGSLRAPDLALADNTPIWVSRAESFTSDAEVHRGLRTEACVTLGANRRIVSLRSWCGYLGSESTNSSKNSLLHIELTLERTLLSSGYRLL